MAILRSDYIPTESETQKAAVHSTSDGKTVVHQQNDVSGILRANHFQQSTQTLHHESQVMNHAARIDVLALKNWCAARGITRRWWMEVFANDGKLLRAFMNDPDNKCWRTRLGKV